MLTPEQVQAMIANVLPCEHIAVEGDGPAGAFKIALQRQHVGMAVDDAGFTGQERSRTAQIRLQRHRLLDKQMING